MHACVQAGAKGAAGKGAVRVHEALWQELESCMKLLHSTVVLMWHLQRVLNKKCDPLTLASFVEAVQVFLPSLPPTFPPVLGTCVPYECFVCSWHLLCHLWPPTSHSCAHSPETSARPGGVTRAFVSRAAACLFAQWKCTYAGIGVARGRACQQCGTDRHSRRYRAAARPVVMHTSGQNVFPTAAVRSGSIHGKGSAVCRACLLYTSPSPRDRQKSRMPSSA